MTILESIENEQQRHSVTHRVGDLVRVHVRIKEGDKERIQVFEGTVIALRRGGGARGSFTVRKLSYGIGVERRFLLHAPSVEKVEVVSRGKVRRAKLFYLRGRRGKAARLKELDMRQEAAKQARRASAQASQGGGATDAAG